MSTIFIAREEGQESYDEVQVRVMLREGTLTPETLYWSDGMPEWRPLSELPSPKPPPPVFAKPPPPSKPKVSEKFYDEDHMVYRFKFMPITRAKRLIAAVIDLFLILIPVLLVAVVTWVFPKATGDDPAHSPVYVAAELAFLAIFCSQFVLIWSGRSMGKNFFILRAVDENSHSNRGFIGSVIRIATHGSFFLVPLCLFTAKPDTWYLTAAIIYAIIDALFIFLRGQMPA